MQHRRPVVHHMNHHRQLEPGGQGADQTHLLQRTEKPIEHRRLKRFHPLDQRWRQPYTFWRAFSQGTLPAVLNAANEEAVAAFLDGRIPFTAIPETIADVMSAHPVQPATGLEDVLAADAWARDEARARIAVVDGAAAR